MFNGRDEASVVRPDPPLPWDRDATRAPSYCLGTFGWPVPFQASRQRPTKCIQTPGEATFPYPSLELLE